MEKFKFENKDYYKIDFNKMTYRQFSVAKKVMKKVFGALSSMNLDIASEIETLKKKKDKESKERLKELEAKSTQEGLNMFINFLDIDNENEVLALLYTESPNTKFDLEKYKKRKELFLDLPLNIIQKTEGVRRDFFGFIQKSLTDGFQIYS